MKLRNLVSVVSVGMISCISSFVFATPANAELTVCNRAGSRAFVAISYDSQSRTWSKGWLQLEPGKCGKAFTGRVSNADIGVYAETFNGVVESGDVSRCVIWVQEQSTWQIKDADQQNRCKGKGREMKGFRVFRTGDSPDYTYEVFD